MASDSFRRVTLLFPVGYVDDPVMILADTAAFLFVPVGGICGTPPVPSTVNFGGKTASIFRVYFRPVSFYSLPETAGIRWNIPRILEVPAGSARRNHRPGQFQIFGLREEILLGEFRMSNIYI